MRSCVGHGSSRGIIQILAPWATVGILVVVSDGGFRWFQDSFRGGVQMW